MGACLLFGLSKPSRRIHGCGLGSLDELAIRQSKPGECRVKMRLSDRELNRALKLLNCIDKQMLLENQVLVELIHRIIKLEEKLEKLENKKESNNLLKKVV